MKILVKWPTRSRPKKFLETLYVYQHLRSTDNVSFLVTIDADDNKMLQNDVINTLKMWGNLRYEIMQPAGKIAAINYGLDKVVDDYDIIVLASDDMVPEVKGWDARIMDDMHQFYPDLDGVLWYNDGYAKDTLNTLCILGRRYYERFGYIYNPEYKALWCDNEFMDVANQLGKQTYFPDIIIRHQHPIWGHGRVDDLNQRDNNLYHEDKRTYERRKSNNFGLSTIIEPINTNLDQQEGVIRKPVKGDKPTDIKRKRRGKSTNL